MRTVWFCEQDEFCRRVLARHWPGVPCHPDVRSLVADTAPQQRRGREVIAQPHMVDDGPQPQHRTAGTGDGDGLPVPVPYVDVLCGGFPCQDISLAGRGAGLAGERSGLWREFARIIGELRPRYVIVENVPALTVRGLDTVLADLAARGFDAEWDHLPASAFGAPHRRDRIWLVAYPATPGLEGQRPHPGQPQKPESRDGRSARLAHADRQAGNGTRPPGKALPRPGEIERPGRRGSSVGNPWESEPDVGRVAHGVPARLHGGGDAHPGCVAEARAEGASDDDLLRAMRQHMALAAASHGPPTCGVCGDPVSDVPRRGGLRGWDAEAAGAEDLRRLRERLHGVQPFQGEDLLAGVPLGVGASERAEALGWWDREPDVGRVAHGVPQRVDRLRALGNALVPQIAEWIGRQIIAWEAQA